MDARAAALAALVQFQVTQTTVGQALQRIAEITQDAVPAAAVVGMSMFGNDGRPTTQIYTDPDSPEIDQAQYEDDKGPCLDAWRQNIVLRVARVQEVAERYPRFAAACLEHGVLSTLSLPMRAGEVALGAVNLYAKEEDAFTEDDEALGADLAAAGAAVLLNVSAYWSAFDLTAQLDEAMRSRAVIEQAKGMLMAQNVGLTADDAFAMLVKVSQRENRKLRDVAQQIVERGKPGGSTADGR
jgi:transcriptional regulator with GAF, ATPase, and Fis domain